MKSFNHFRIFFLTLFCFLFLIFFSACSSNQKSKSYYFKDGVVINASTNELYSGKVSEEVNNKKIVYDVVKGKKNGRFVTYFENGLVEMIGTIHNNKNDGKWQYFSSNSKLECEGNFKEDKVEGKWSWFYPDGSIKEEGSYTAGKRNGVWIIYNKDGSLRLKRIFINDEKINEVEYHKVQIS